MKNHTIANPEVEPDRICLPGPVLPDDFCSRTCEYTINCLLKQWQGTTFINGRPKLRLKSAVVMIQSKLCLYSNLQKYFRHVCFFFILNLLHHLMYSLDFKTVDKVVYRTENSSIQSEVIHDELSKIQSRLAGLVPGLA